jgi:DNA-directed RNA polymerase subunit RPC12/RpoP
MSFECDTCDRTFGSQSACTQHMNDTSHHFAGYDCDTCDRNFITTRARDQHMTALDHWKWPVECETCTMRFVNEWYCEEHMEAQDHFSYNYECATCNLIYRNAEARDSHQEEEGHYRHLHCSDCDRYFQNSNNLDQHMKSRIHQGANVRCSHCLTGFTTASGLSHHLETGSCPNAPELNREVIHRAISRRDRNNVITERVLTYKNTSIDPTWDPMSAWNGYGYECYFCHREFNSPHGLKQHITSPVHQASLYHCPNRGRCGKTFVSLAAMFNHLESESCGYTRFADVGRDMNRFFTGHGQNLVAFG